MTKTETAAVDSTENSVEMRQLLIGQELRKKRLTAKEWTAQNVVSWRFGNNRKHVIRVYRLSNKEIKLARVNLASPTIDKKIMVVSEIYHISVIANNGDSTYTPTRNLYIGRHVAKNEAVILSGSGDIKRTFQGSLKEGDLVTDLEDGVRLVEKAHSRAELHDNEHFHSAHIPTPMSIKAESYIPVVAWFQTGDK
jgi:hypothetical protein